MKCRACNNDLKDNEATRKYLFIDEYIDMCTRCTDEAGIPRTDRTETPQESTEPAVEEETVEVPDPFEESLGG